ncbi:hypothetical protein [Roseomonas chloroacetimidivorans]|uniref:hypothetical protein n=1 Tax=Roseomonas chloroacetimidivorans TaxID=1766656 RepID=UPI003C7476D7
MRRPAQPGNPARASALGEAARPAGSAEAPRSAQGVSLSVPQQADRHIVSETLGLYSLYARHGGRYVRTPFQFRQQADQLEWHSRWVRGRLSSITLTCETAESWSQLARDALDQATELYRFLLDESRIRSAELCWQSDIFIQNPEDAGRFTQVYAAGDYNPLNMWNTLRGAVHLTRTSLPEAALHIPFGRRRGGCALWGMQLPTAGIISPAGDDVTRDAIRITRRHPATGAVLRIEVFAPRGADFEFDELVLSDGLPVTGCRLASMIQVANMQEGGPPQAALGRICDPRIDRPTLPSPAVAAAMLRAGGFGAEVIAAWAAR